MADVGQTGSTQNAPVDYSSKAGAADGAKSSERVSAGDLDQRNIRFADQKTRSEVLKGQQVRAPKLDVPEDVKPTAIESANSDVGDIGKAIEKAITSTDALIKNGVNGTLTPEQQARVKQHGKDLTGAANYLSALHGNGLGAAEGKRSVLAGLGFNMAQLDALMSLANPDDAGNSLASLHGASLQGKKDALSSLGFSESQIEALLSLADPDDSGNSLVSLRQAGSDVKAALKALGFTATQAERLQALLNGQSSLGSTEQKQLLMQMGLSEEAAEVVLTSADPDSVKQQDSLLKGASPEQIVQLQKVGQLTTAFVEHGPTYSEGIVGLMVDIFMVMQLVHELSVNKKRSSREYRSIQFDASKEETLNQVDEMKKAATNTLIGGLVTGGTKMAAGGITAAGAFGGANARAPAGADATAQSQAKSAAMQQSMQKATALSQMTQGGGEMAGSVFNYEASMHTARQKEHEALQKTHENAAQSASEFMQLHQDSVKSVQGRMSEIISSLNETMRSTSRI